MRDLVKNQRLADVAPAGGGTEVVNQQEQQQHEGDAGRGVDGVDQEHHDGAAHDAQDTRVPGKVTKSGPGKRTEGRRAHLGEWLGLEWSGDVRLGSYLKPKSNNRVYETYSIALYTVGRIAAIPVSRTRTALRMLFCSPGCSSLSPPSGNHLHFTLA